MAARTQKWRGHAQRWLLDVWPSTSAGRRAERWGVHIFTRFFASVLSLVDNKGGEENRRSSSWKFLICSAADKVLHHVCQRILLTYNALVSPINLYFCCLARLTTLQLQKLIEAEAQKVLFTLQCQTRTRLRVNSPSVTLLLYLGTVFTMVPIVKHDVHPVSSVSFLVINQNDEPLQLPLKVKTCSPYITKNMTYLCWHTTPTCE